MDPHVGLEQLDGGIFSPTLVAKNWLIRGDLILFDNISGIRFTIIQLVVAQALNIGEIFTTKLTYFVRLNLSSMDSLVSLQMPSFSELFWTLVTVELWLSVIQFVSGQTTFVTEQFGTFLALKLYTFMDRVDVSLKVILDVVHNIAMRTWEILYIHFPNAMKFSLMLLTILQPGETLPTMLTNMLCLFRNLWTVNNSNMSVKVSLDTPKSRTDCT